VESRVIRHQSDLGRFERVERTPDPRLRGIVHRYCGYAHAATGQRVRRREVAQDKVTLILGFGPPLGLGGPGVEMADQHCFVTALSDSYAVTEHDGLHGIQIDLSPLGAHMLFGVAMHELSGLFVPFEDVLGRDGCELVSRLYEAPGWDARFALLDRYIGARIEQARPPSPDVARAWQRLTETRGTLRIADLTRELGCSRRHLAARFAEQIGAPPKVAARLLRFQSAVSRLGHDDGRRFAEIAQDCGYYDQAHLNRDFRELGGTTPGEFVAKLLPAGFGVGA
jgi:AraC-like DNA-binding protein